jgi:hypothetical protein
MTMAMAVALILAGSSPNALAASPAVESPANPSLCAHPFTLPNPQPLATPIGCITGWATNADYPRKALKRQTPGWTIMRLQVSDTGAPVACTNLVPGGDAPLDARTCALVLQRARFTPATDGSGKPVAGTFIVCVVWQPPGMAISLPPPGWAPYRSVPWPRGRLFNSDDDRVRKVIGEQREGVVGYNLTISAEGRPVACAITHSSQDPILDQETCDWFITGPARFTHAIDEMGNPVPGHYHGSIRWQIPRD